MNIDTILWPTDLSARSVQAAPVVKDLAEQYNAKILLLYVGFDLDQYFPAYGEPSPETKLQFQDWEFAEASKRLEEVCTDKLSDCKTMDTRLSTGDPATEIVRIAEEEKADLIIMSPRGKGEEKSDQKYLGSVTNRVLSNANTNVLTVYP